MDFSKIRFPVALILGALGFAAGVGAINSRQATAEEHDKQQDAQIQELQRETQAALEHAARVETLLQITAQTVERIEKKLDRR